MESQCLGVNTDYKELKTDILKQHHHEQQELCLTRPPYRQGQKLTSVKVYTVSDESTHLLIHNVPSIKLQAEVCKLCKRFGDITTCNLIPDYEGQKQFTDTFHVKYSRIQASRYAKKQLDGRAFYGDVLHVCYAPELETVADTRAKLLLRRKEVAKRINQKNSSQNHRQTWPERKHTNPGYITTAESINTFTEDETNQISQPITQSQTQLQCDEQYKPLNHSSEAWVSGNSATTSSVNPSTSNPCQPGLNQLKLVPRPVAIKRIMFHKK